MARANQTTGGGRCPDCGKVRYLTKGGAKNAASRIQHRVGRLDPYRCGMFWHLGHLPAGVISGRYSRDELGQTTRLGGDR